MRKIFFALVTLLCVSGLIEADDWTPYTSIGEGVSVSFKQVQKTTYTWSFRNDQSTIITSMTFSYSYFDAKGGEYKTDKDVIPLSIKPGKAFGGWAAFSAETRTQPTITILGITRK